MNRATFDIQPLHRFGGSNTTIRRPKRRFSLGDASLSYYYPPRLPADLNVGFDTFQKLNDVADEHLDALLDTIIAYEKETKKKCETDIVTWRGMMTKVSYKFEAISVLRQPWDPSSREEIEGREEAVVNNSAQYCSVARTGMGNVRMILGGEVDADPVHWVELKTSAEIRNDRDMVKYERKLLKFWAQSFLLGVPKIIVGFRDQNGIVRSLEELETASIPGKVKKVGRGTWDGNICINFAAAFLEWLKQTIQEDGSWRIRKQEKSPVIEVFKLEEQGHGGILSPAFTSWRSASTISMNHQSQTPPLSLHPGMDSSSSTGSPGTAPGAIRSRKTTSIAKRACDQCKFRKIKVNPSGPLCRRIGG
ncbi:hypothetical protein N7510_005554 [Penicillium lagena]|uniref:uncharacterized protein n=1 Tax=Penicillium lagena TaxID=94218 RepID=UPI00253FB934|nr:uncharacterized protein N7510_005554 [Penicillium lagena]KAJ5612360.1 hypothetical protein N7510_005554 [Penicillium lagena]